MHEEIQKYIYMITKIHLANFTAFKDISLDFDKGINIFIGENGTGKTHVMKAIYSACAIEDVREERTFDQKLKAVFMPNTIGRLVHRSKGRNSGKIIVFKKDNNKECSISCEISTLNNVKPTLNGWTTDKPQEAVFIPVKDMLANAPGFRSLVSQKKIFFEEIYQDIIDKAFLPISKGKLAKESSDLLDLLGEVMSGKVVEKNETFYLKNKNGELEFPLLAEGFRKLGLLYKLIQNETLTKGSILFWDEPEANLNPKLSRVVVKIILKLQEMGVQVFISTHDYVLLKEFELEQNSDSSILYHVFYRNEDEDICHKSTKNQDELTPNAIDNTFSDMLDREIQKGLESYETDN